MKIVYSVPADFCSPKGQQIFHVGTDVLNKAVEAPDWVQYTNLYKFLLSENLIHLAADVVKSEPAPVEPVKADAEPEAEKSGRKARQPKAKDEAE